jgi:hypothetical protein
MKGLLRPIVVSHRFLSLYLPEKLTRFAFCGVVTFRSNFSSLI